MMWRLFKPKQPDVPAVALPIPAEPLTGKAKALDRKADLISKRNAKKAYAIRELARDITGLGDELIDKFGGRDQ